MAIDTDAEKRLYKDDFLSLDIIDRTGFVWGQSATSFDQILDYLTRLDRDKNSEEQIRRRLLFDRDEVLRKYGLLEETDDISQDILTLVEFCQLQGIFIGNKADYQRIYGIEMTSDAFCDDFKPQIFLGDQPENEPKKIGRFYRNMRHEVIHARQIITGRNLSLSPEQVEYEAFVGASMDTGVLENNFSTAVNHIAWGMLQSLGRYYVRNNLEPPWKKTSN